MVGQGTPYAAADVAAVATVVLAIVATVSEVFEVAVISPHILKPLCSFC